jgi:hypothetical protein
MSVGIGEGIGIGIAVVAAVVIFANVAFPRKSSGYETTGGTRHYRKGGTRKNRKR